jgi:hypothetical protein
LKNNLLKELADIDQIIEKLESRRADIVNMLDVIKVLSTFEMPVSETDQLHEKVVSISIKSHTGQSK